MQLQTWFIYVAAVFVLTVTPGPSVLMCVTQGVNIGARRTFFCAIGSITSVVGIMVCSAVGVGAALASSAELFNTIKWFGVLYLLYIGITTLMSSNSSFEVPENIENNENDEDSKVNNNIKNNIKNNDNKNTRLSLYIKGLLVGASNPKALLFFTAFFPQFINPTAPQLPQFLILGATFVAFELFWLMFYASFASRLAPWLRTPGRAKMFNRVSGATFIAASALLATVKRQS
jgi:threonine/homoserine/homoserine lactone efflux protein